MQGSIINRINESGKPSIPEVGQFATSYSYTDRDVHYIVKVEDNGRVFWTKDVGRCFKRPEWDAIFEVDEDGKTRVTVYDKYKDDIRVDNRIYLTHPSERDFWIYLFYDEDIGLDRWVLLKDGKYHRSLFDQSTRKYRNSIKNKVISPGIYSYYYDPSF